MVTMRRKQNKKSKKSRSEPKMSASNRFPNETPAYRRARERLLRAESGLRKQVEFVAALRRKLPAGGLVQQDYVFEGVDALTGMRSVRLSELFAPGKDTLILYSFMFGPDMAHACPMCTAMIDSLDGAATHVSQRVNLAVVAKSPLQRILSFARERGWRHVQLLSSEGNSYNRDYHGEDEGGKQWPMLNVFVKRNDKVRHFWASELMFVKAAKGQNQRHVDMIWPLWNLLDVTPEGRGSDWYPKLAYSSQSA
jgi:predicted dithiol-disulfide oxidoreductase (DUF899 family)